MSKTAVMAAGVLGSLSVACYRIYQQVREANRLREDLRIRQQSVEDIIREIYLRVNTKENMTIVYNMCELDCRDKEELLKPYQYTLQTGGKRIRLIMAIVVSEMFESRRSDGVVKKEVLLVGGLIELLHSASLIIDDIEDGSQERRGKPCSYLVHGLDKSINAANLMYFLPFKKLMEGVSDARQRTELLKIFIEEMTISHLGQAQDIQVHKIKKSEELPTLEEYETLTIAKTGSLLRMMVRMLCVVLHRSRAEADQLCEIMNYVGLAFQVTDDVLNLTNNLGKGELAEDLKQKKFTPIINHMRGDHDFMQKFIADNKSQTDIHWMLNRIRDSEALLETKKLAEVYKDLAQNLITSLSTPHSKGHFEKLMMFIITRQN